MQISFYKYQGTGNDFIIIDDRDTEYDRVLTDERIRFLCHRRFGIGADGLILLKNSKNIDFKMVYFNADGNESSMCGNGGRCVVHFARFLHIFDERTTFDAIDGEHEALVSSDGLIHLRMNDVHQIESLPSGNYQLNTGSPHYITFCHEWPENIVAEGASVRYSPTYAHEGINVNFVKVTSGCLEVATYERGVEDETLSCGTGVTAAALVHALKNNEFGHLTKHIKTKGGDLKISFHLSPQGSASDIWLIGPVQQVFEGKIEISFL